MKQSQQFIIPIAKGMADDYKFRSRALVLTEVEIADIFSQASNILAILFRAGESSGISISSNSVMPRTTNNCPFKSCIRVLMELSDWEEVSIEDDCLREAK
jgi:hypothetical protein